MPAPHRSIRSHWLALALLTASAWAGEAPPADINPGWRFALGDPANAQATAFDDAAWQQIDLPHDWAISGPFDPAGDPDTAKLPWKGVGWYRKELILPAAPAGSRVYLDFGAVMAESTVYINGQKAGGWDDGYASFRVDATPYAKLGAKNLVAVRADTRTWSTRWYPGAGIYRTLRLVIAPPVHIGHWGVGITTPAITAERAEVAVRTAIENHLAAAQTVRLTTRLLDPAGTVVATATTQDERIDGNGQRELVQNLSVARPALWDPARPLLYRAESVLTLAGRDGDTAVTTFGIRSLRLDAAKGLFLNERPVKIHGVCLHHDQGPLGAALLPRALERQLETIKEFGANAVRTSHNPAAPELYDFCDRMGLLVLDEAFDKWNHLDPAFPDHAQRQIRNFVRRDRNHPCVFMWDAGNELKDEQSPEVVAMAKRMVGFFHAEDPSRPVTVGIVGGGPLEDVLDVAGSNYHHRYEQRHARNPARPQIATETASTVSTRGSYAFPLPRWNGGFAFERNQASSYDLTAPDWAQLPDEEFAHQEAAPYVVGEFAWTGFDYLGEPTPFGTFDCGKQLTAQQSARSSCFGIVDLCGFAKDRFHLYRSHWAPDRPTLHILPHWTWPGREGQATPVFVYTDGDSAELFLNGASQGRRTKTTPPNLAAGKTASASSEESYKGNRCANAVDGDRATRWCAATGDADQWWQVDLGSVQAIRCVALTLELPSASYRYRISGSVDGQAWTTLAEKTSATGGSPFVQHDVEASVRHVRITFTGFSDNAWASIYEVGVYAQLTDPGGDPYRLRWYDVPYQPGELKAVAYRDGRKIRETVMRTAAAPATLHLSADRPVIAADGYDLSYVTIDLLDAKGVPVPTADVPLSVTVGGAATIAAMDNGDASSLVPFQSASRSTYHGKALVILRSKRGTAGNAVLTVTSPGLPTATVQITTRP